MTFSPKTVCLLGALALATGATGALAQDTSPHDKGKTVTTGPGDPGQRKTTETSYTKTHNLNVGMHSMPATVDTVDTKTGIVEVKSEGMSLKLHFPPPSVEDLKSGDNITVHLSYTKK